MTAFHLSGNRVERQIQFVEHMKISVCRDDIKFLINEENEMLIDTTRGIKE